jgi:hypothetical protein
MCLLLTGAEAKAVPVESLVLEIQEAAGAAPEPAEVANGGAPQWPKRSVTKYCQIQAWK